MAIINNAHAGSQVNLLCMIYRVIFRNDGRFTVDEISRVCAPSNLPTLSDHIKRFPDNLRFWMHEAHQLWRENEEGNLRLTRMAASASPPAIAIVTNEALFARPIDDIFGRDANDTEGLFRSLGCLLASDRFVLESNQRISKTNLQQFYADNLPGYIPNDSEKVIVGRYGHFLGFLELDAMGDYLVDPTRAVRGVLNYVFAEKRTLPIGEFLERAATAIPLLDTGQYRQQIEAKMQGPVSADGAGRRLSKSLSLAIERLVSSGVLGLEFQSDDPDACSLQLRDGVKAVSTVQYVTDGDAI